MKNHRLSRWKFIAYTIVCMKWVESVYRFFSERLKILYGKKYTTLAGALTYFFWMSLLPFCFLLTALFGASVQRVEWLLKAEIFQGVRDFLYYVFEHARNSSGGINLFLGITAFWSASNFFYQLRHCGGNGLRGNEDAQRLEKPPVCHGGDACDHDFCCSTVLLGDRFGSGDESSSFRFLFQTLVLSPAIFVFLGALYFAQ